MFLDSGSLTFDLFDLFNFVKAGISKIYLTFDLYQIGFRGNIRALKMVHTRHMKDKDKKMPPSKKRNKSIKNKTQSKENNSNPKKVTTKVWTKHSEEEIMNILQS